MLIQMCRLIGRIRRRTRRVQPQQSADSRNQPTIPVFSANAPSEHHEMELWLSLNHPSEKPLIFNLKFQACIFFFPLAYQTLLYQNPSCFTMSPGSVPAFFAFSAMSSTLSPRLRLTSPAAADTLMVSSRSSVNSAFSHLASFSASALST